MSPKDKDNDFGGFKYRNVEGILRNVKPLLNREGLYCRLSDEAVDLNGSTYIKAIAELVDTETGEAVQSTAYAREMETKKGMDASQCTGCASTYARKYALCGLLGLDDTQTKPVNETDSQAPSEHDAETQQEREAVLNQIYGMGVTREELDAFIQTRKPKDTADTVSVGNLRSIKVAIAKKRAGQ